MSSVLGTAGGAPFVSEVEGASVGFVTSLTGLVGVAGFVSLESDAAVGSADAMLGGMSCEGCDPSLALTISPFVAGVPF